MRLVVRHPDDQGKSLVRSEANDERLRAWLAQEIEDGLAARFFQEAEWQDALRRYEAVPKNPTRDVPVENAPNIEIALGAIAADSIQAQFLDTLFTVSPFVTVRPVGNDSVAADNAAALQRRINHGCATEWNLRSATDTAVLDDVQLGTAVLYCPWVEEVRKTDLATVTDCSSRIIAWPIEDVLVPGGCDTDIQRTPWVALRSWYGEGELVTVARQSGWDTQGFKATAGQGWLRTRREQLGRTTANAKLRYLYEVFHVFCHFDYDDDGVDEDLLAVFDRSGRALAVVDYMPYDSRPLVAMRYQKRAYLFYGLGVLDMTRSEQEAVSELMNQGLLNVQLQNAGIIAVREGAVEDHLKLWSGKVVPCQDPTGDIQPKTLAQPAPATAQYIAMNMSLAERRVGVNEMSMPRPSQVLGARTPGITAMSLLQQTNRRFTPAFDQVRLGLGEAVMQCVFREAERLKAGDARLEQHLTVLLGADDAQRVMTLLRDPDFDKQVTVEITAASASVNREADRQNALLLVQVLGTYYEKVLMLVQLAANPQLPQPIRDVAKKIADAGGKIIERALTTFDSVRDPQSFLIDAEQEIDALAPQMNPQGLMGLASLLGGQGQPPGGPPPPNGAAGVPIPILPISSTPEGP